MRVLVVDDEAPIVRVVAKRFESAGYEVLTASNGRIGLELALCERPALVISDVQMPELDGIGLARGLKDALGGDRPPIVLLTARSFMITDAQVHEAGVTALMGKPFSARKLLELAEEILANSTRAEAA
jgi:DNA-binding response OmpR family regulator